MLGSEIKSQVFSSADAQPSKQEMVTPKLKKTVSMKKEVSPAKMSPPKKMMASPSKLSSPVKTSSQSSALKRQTRSSGTKPQATSKVELAKKKETSLNKPLQATNLLKAETLEPFAAELFEALHLLYEDVKLDRLRFAAEGKKLRRFLLAWLLEDGSKSVPKTAYVSYYLAESDS